jgi:hypothetical protein
VPPSADQLTSFLQRLRRAVTEGRVEIRAYALDGLRDLEWTANDLRLQLLDLTADDFVERAGVVVISFHRG